MKHFIFALLLAPIVAQSADLKPIQKEPPGEVVLTQPGAGGQSMTGEQKIFPENARVNHVAVTPLLTEASLAPEGGFKYDLTLVVEVTVEHEVAYVATGSGPEKKGERIPDLAFITESSSADHKVGVTTNHSLKWMSNPFFSYWYGIETKNWEWETSENRVHRYYFSVINWQYIYEDMGTEGPANAKWYHVVLDIEGYKNLVVYHFRIKNGKLTNFLTEKVRG